MLLQSFLLLPTFVACVAKKMFNKDEDGEEYDVESNYSSNVDTDSYSDSGSYSDTESISEISDNDFIDLKKYL